MVREVGASSLPLYEPRAFFAVLTPSPEPSQAAASLDLPPC